MKKKFLEVGKISGTHGVRGMVRIQPWCDEGFLQKFKTFYLDADGKHSLICEKAQPNGNVYIAKFKGINDIDNAEAKIVFPTVKKVFCREGISSEDSATMEDFTGEQEAAE